MLQEELKEFIKKQKKELKILKKKTDNKEEIKNLIINQKIRKLEKEKEQNDFIKRELNKCYENGKNK